MTRSGTSLAPLLLLVVACGGEKKQEEERRPPLGSVASLGAIPAEAQVVVGVNVARVRDSALARRAIRRVLDDDPAAWRWLTDLLGRCRIDPARDLESVIVGAADLSGGDLVLVAQGTLDEARITECVRAAATERGGTVESTTVAGAPALRVSASAVGDAAPAVSWVAWGGPRTVIVATSEAWLARARDPAAPKLAAQGDLRPLLERLDTSKALWGAALLPEDAGRSLAAATGGVAQQPARAVHGHFDAVTGLQVEVQAEMQSDADARGVVEFGEGELRKLRVLAHAAGLGAAANQVELGHQGRFVKAALALSFRDAEALMARLEEHGTQETPSAPEEGAPR